MRPPRQPPYRVAGAHITTRLGTRYRCSDRLKTTGKVGSLRFRMAAGRGFPSKRSVVLFATAPDWCPHARPNPRRLAEKAGWLRRCAPSSLRNAVVAGAPASVAAAARRLVEPLVQISASNPRCGDTGRLCGTDIRNGSDWRRGRDSNPRWAFDPYALSRGAPSTTRPPLRQGTETPLRSAG